MTAGSEKKKVTQSKDWSCLRSELSLEDIKKAKKAYIYREAQPDKHILANKMEGMELVSIGSLLYNPKSLRCLV